MNATNPDVMREILDRLIKLETIASETKTQLVQRDDLLRERISDARRSATRAHERVDDLSKRVWIITGAAVALGGIGGVTGALLGTS